MADGLKAGDNVTIEARVIAVMGDVVAVELGAPTVEGKPELSGVYRTEVRVDRRLLKASGVAAAQPGAEPASGSQRQPTPASPSRPTP